MESRLGYVDPDLLLSGLQPLPGQVPEPLNSGKWTEDEEAYVKGLVEEFHEGKFFLPRGASLRKFLSKMLNCRPKRISKKFEGTDYAQGRQFYEKRAEKLTPEEIQVSYDKLVALQIKYRDSLKRMPQPAAFSKNSLPGPAGGQGLDAANPHMASFLSANVQGNPAALLGGASSFYPPSYGAAGLFGDPLHHDAWLQSRWAASLGPMGFGGRFPNVQGLSTMFPGGLSDGNASNEALAQLMHFDRQAALRNDALLRAASMPQQQQLMGFGAGAPGMHDPSTLALYNRLLQQQQQQADEGPSTEPALTNSGDEEDGVGVSTKKREDAPGNKDLAEGTPASKKQRSE